MAITKVTLKEGFFAENNGVHIQVFTPTHVIANGWECKIEEDGTLFCEALRIQSDGEHCMRYIIQPNGFAKLTLKKPYSRVQVLKKGYLLPKGSKLTEGVLGISGGDIDERFAYFRADSFQEFLDTHKISAVKHIDPNKMFLIRHIKHRNGEHVGCLDTDGEKECLCSGVAYEEEGVQGVEELVGIKDANWVLHTEWQNETQSWCRILYTLINPLKIKELPAIPQPE